MKISLYQQKGSDNKSEELLYFRLRFKNLKKWESSYISTSVKVLPKHFKNGSISTRTSNYNDKMKIINSMFDDLENIVGELHELNHIPNPSLVKKLYSERLNTKKITTPKIKSFWSSFDEFYDSKKHKTRGYTKTLQTLKNHLISFQEETNQRITFDFIISKTPIFQSQLNDFFWTKKKITNGYINKMMSNLSNFLYWSKEMGYIQKKPKFEKLSEVDRDEKIYLRTDEVIKLFNSKKWDYEDDKSFNNKHIHTIQQELLGTQKMKWGKKVIEDGEEKYYLRVTSWELVKDIFLFMSSVGNRYSDISSFKLNHFDFNSSIKHFSWIQQKTQKRVFVPVTDISSYIFTKYSRGKNLSQELFPPISQQKFNKQLKLLLKDLKFNRLVSHPKRMGSKTINIEEKYLWELISSHSGRRSFIKNLIDRGEMDYKSIMKLSGHRSYTEFLKYVSVTDDDLKKGSNLYRLEQKDQEEEIDEILKIYSSLSIDEKPFFMDMIRRFR